MWNMFRVAASGLQAQQRAMDVTANNLANLQTTGFKSRRAVQVELPPGSDVFGVPGQNGVTPGPHEIGEGAATGAILPNFANGPLQPTGQPLDVAIVGDGFLQVTLPDGRQGYTRDGALRLDGQGRLTIGGSLVAGGITAPPGSTNLAVDADGRVMAQVNGSPDRQVIGQLQLARFTNPDGLSAVGQNILVATVASGDAVTGAPGENGFGELAPGALEGSNVDVAAEFVQMIQAQRAYSVSLRTLKTIDEMMQEANNLRQSP